MNSCNCVCFWLSSLCQTATALKGAYHKGSQSMGVFFSSTFIALLIPLCKKGLYLFRLLVGMNFLDLVRTASFVLFLWDVSWIHIVFVVIQLLSHVQLIETPWTVAHKFPLSMVFSQQEYWSGFPCPPPGDLPDPGVEPASLMSPALAGRFFTTSATWEAHGLRCVCVC